MHRTPTPHPALLEQGTYHTYILAKINSYHYWSLSDREPKTEKTPEKWLYNLRWGGRGEPRQLRDGPEASIGEPGEPSSAKGPQWYPELPT